MAIQKHNLTLLYVEDDQGLRESYTDFFTRRVERLILADNGEKGLQAYQEHRPDIIVTDIRMPGMDGVELIRKVRQQDKQTPIVVTSAFSEQNYLLEAINLGVTRYVLKPLQRENLKQVMDETIELILLRKKESAHQTELQQIMDTQKSIVLLTDRQGIKQANKFFAEATGFSSLEEFKQKHRCICELFQDVNKEHYVDKETFKGCMRDGSLSALSGKKAKMYCTRCKKDKIYYISAESYLDEDSFVVTMTDITVLEDAMEQVDAFNHHLYQMVEEGIEKQRRQEALLIQQSRMAAMGEMINNIAHQWKQPLNIINILIEGIRDSYEYNELTEEELEKESQKIKDTVAYMNTTINDFRNFFKPSKEKKAFNVKREFDSVYKLLEPSLLKQGIEIEIEEKAIASVFGFSNEFKQVIINLLNNAKDILLEKNVKPPRIKITIDTDAQKQMALITLWDNGGGIPEILMPHKLFEAYNSTKGEKGTGIGLYMSKQIIETNMGGILSASNVDGGAQFTIQLPLEKGNSSDA